MQAAKRVCNAVPTHDLNIWIKALWALAWAWQSFVGPQVGASFGRFVGVRVGVP